jgi:hypothetical protein
VKTTIQVVSFNSNESAAVELLLDDLLTASSPWSRSGEHGIERPFGEDDWRIEHVPLRAQGNVAAGAQLVEYFREHKPQDYIVFYGCAGALIPTDMRSPFLVQRANYLSLGTVEDGADGNERVTLKNKWLCHLRPPSKDPPLRTVEFPLCIAGDAAIDLCRLSGIPPARVAATDKVIRIKPGLAPTPTVNSPPHDEYAKAEWSYGAALGLMTSVPGPVLVEMESYGIGRMAQALQVEKRVVVLRITTDELSDQASSDTQQRDLLARARPFLGRVIVLLFDPRSLQ